MTNENSTIQLANALRVLAMDAVEAAKSGHPGMPMGMADIAEVLWRNNLKHNPLNPEWSNRIDLFYPMVMVQCFSTDSYI